MTKDPDQTVQVHLVCQAHLDPIWIWDWPEGLTEALATFESAADLLDEYSELVFNHNESVLYEWTREYKPELFERIRAHVREGRWVISGGWYLQPDANLPSGESLARHILLGRGFFEQEFGVTSKVAYNLDTFGHNANMPQFLRLSGYAMYTHFRPRPDEKRLPDFLYRWRGVDGSEVIGFRPPCGWYCTHPGSLVGSKIEEMRTLAIQEQRPTTAFWGAGNHGGGATRADLEVIREVMQKNPGVVHSSFERYFTDVAKSAALSLPVVSGELQKCFTGCYTSIIGIKQRNRRGEGLALAAERFSALAWWLLEESYPASRLAGIWKDVLFNQFHDILPGSAIREGAVSSAEMLGRAVTEAKEVLLKAQLQLIRRKEKSAPLTVRILNPHPVRRTVPAIVDIQLTTHPELMKGKYLGLYDSAGNEICRQLLGYRRNTAEWRSTFLFDAELPSFGIAEYSVRLEDAPDPDAGHDEISGASEDPDAFIHTNTRLLTDDGCRKGSHDPWHAVDPKNITIDSGGYTAVISRATGALISLVDKGLGREFLGGPSARLVVRDDTNDAWGGQQTSYGPIVGEFEVPGTDDLSEITAQYGEREPAPAVRVIASGPLAVVVETLSTYKRSVARLRYTFYRHHHHIDLEVMLNYGERRRAVQMEIVTTLQGTEYDVEIPHATVTRPRNGGEEPMGRWITLRDGSQGLTLVNDGPGGVEIQNQTIRQTLVRSPVYCSGNDSVEPGFLGDHMDLGEHRYRFRILFGTSEAIIAERQLAADDLCLPFSYHCSVPLGASVKPGLVAGTVPLVIEAVSGNGVVHLEALKVSEDGTALILRMAERKGYRTLVRVEAHGISPVELEFRPYEIKTMRAERDAETHKIAMWTECDLLEQPLKPEP